VLKNINPICPFHISEMVEGLRPSYDPVPPHNPQPFSPVLVWRCFHLDCHRQYSVEGGYTLSGGSLYSPRCFRHDEIPLSPALALREADAKYYEYTCPIEGCGSAEPFDLPQASTVIADKK
jgi:hypothetical protein